MTTYASPFVGDATRRFRFPDRTPTTSDATATPAAQLGEALEVATVIGSQEQTLAATPSWWPGAIERLVELRHLGPNWDGYGAEPLSLAAAMRAVGFLGAVAVAWDDVPEPFLTPIHSGIQIEWDGPSHAIEVELRLDRTRLVIELEGEVVYDGRLTEGLGLLNTQLRALANTG